MEIKCLTIKNEEYPQKLKEIINPPKKLYVMGNSKILNGEMIAMVGGRECSKYGKGVAQKLGYELGKKKIMVVSGMARGIDAYSHIGAIQAGIPTIAVLRMWGRCCLSRGK